MSVYLAGDHVVGQFQCDSGVLVVCDPCYRSADNLIARFDNAKSGQWQASIRVVDLGPGLGKRVESLIVAHVAHGAADGPWLDAARAVAVDTGRMVVCDGRCDLDGDCSLPRMAVILARGVMVAPGFGDDIYPCRYREAGGEVVVIELFFIDLNVLEIAAGGAQ